MLDVLGLSARDEAVYRTMLERPNLDIAGLAAYLAIDIDDVRSALDALVDLALVRVSTDTICAVRPQAGLTALLARAEAEILARQHQIEATRAAVAAIATAYSAHDEHDEVIRLDGLETVRERLAELAHAAQSECLSFTPSGAQHSATMAAEKPSNLVALQRGVTIRNLYLDSIRNDPATLAHARWMAEQGGQSRTVATLPMRMVIVDRKIALVPSDPHQTDAGALELHSPGIITGLVNLFEQLWATATPLAETPARNQHGLNPQESELLRLLAQGHTDQSAARHMGISMRTVQRTLTELTDQLGTTSRFQTGVEATKRGWT
jgi:DNA-binding CsgD family transcriptional regulator/sugar-specific transcriptional regulator TrmB